jgi:hypothetical protein
MKMKKLIALFLLFLTAPAFALEVADVKLPDNTQVGNASLQLNGAGIRTKFFIKIYVGALYLPQKQATAEAIIADEHEHRVALHILHGLSSEKLFNALSEAIEANHTPAELNALNAQLKQMAQILDTVKEVRPGDVVTLDYLPASGTQISVNSILRGTIAGAAFNRALLKIWLGERPVQDDLKLKMLGQ